jgi:flagellar biosynthetic protein FliO
MLGRRNPRWAGLLATAVLAGVLLLALGQMTLGSAPPPPPPAAAAPAAEAGFLRDYESLQTEFQPLPWWTLAGDIAIKLLLVLGLFFVAVRLLKPLASGTAAMASHGLITVLGTVPLGPQRQVYLLEVGDRVLVVGATSQQLTTLTEITDPEVVERFRGTQRAAASPFAEQLSGLVEQWAPRLLREQFHEGQGAVRARLAEWRRIARQPEQERPG